MRIAAFFLIAFHGFLSFASFAAKKRRREEGQKRIVHLPFLLACVGLLCGSLLCIPAVLCAISGSRMFFFWLVVVLGCDCMMIAYLNCVIHYDSTGFLARNFLGIRRQCPYEEVEGIRSGKDHRIYFQGHCVMIDEISFGGDEFMQTLKKEYRKATGKQLPVSPAFKRKWDPMNGHLDYPWFYFIVWITMALFCIGMPVLFAYTMTTETDVSEMIIKEVRFYSYKKEKESLLLYAEGREDPYEIDYFQSYGQALPSPEVLCNGELYYVGTIGARRYIKSLTSPDGTQLITPETAQQVYRDNQKVAGLILCLLSPFGVYFCYKGIAVARHPERYSDKVRRRYYKDGYLH